MRLPRISIVIPSYNQGQFLEETIRSVTGQQYPDTEIFVVDGGSSDNTPDIIKKYESKLAWWVSEKDNGQSDAINKGFARATGEIITWLNSDDLYTTGALHRVAGHFSKQGPDTGLIYGGTVLFRENKDIGTDWGYDNPSVERNVAGMAFSQPSAFFLKKYLDKIGGRVNEGLHYGMDYDLYCKLACVCRFLRVDDIFSRYRLHDSSKSVSDHNKFIGDWNKTFVNLCKNLDWGETLNQVKEDNFFQKGSIDWFEEFLFSPDKSIVDAIDRGKVLFYHYCYLLKALYWNGEHAEARRLIKGLKKTYPAAWMTVEKDIPPILKKLALPEFVLQTFKRIKKLS